MEPLLTYTRFAPAAPERQPERPGLLQVVCQCAVSK